MHLHDYLTIACLPFLSDRICSLNTPGIIFCTSKWKFVCQPFWIILLQKSGQVQAARILMVILQSPALLCWGRWWSKIETHRLPSTKPSWHMYVTSRMFLLQFCCCSASVPHSVSFLFSFSRSVCWYRRYWMPGKKTIKYSKKLKE